jgi:hypothetical protein
MDYDLFDDTHTTLCYFTPLHTFFVIEQTEPNLHISFLDTDKLEEMLKNDPNVLKHEFIERSPNAGDGIPNFILTASPKEMQTFFSKHIQEFLTEPGYLTRSQPIYTEEDISFDENLIGKWDEGSVLIQKWGENAYKITSLDEDMPTVYANLVEKNNVKLLAVFVNEEDLTPTDGYPFHLTPELFFTYEISGSELNLESIDYEEASNLLMPEGDNQNQEIEDKDDISKKSQNKD